MREGGGARTAKERGERRGGEGRRAREDVAVGGSFQPSAGGEGGIGRERERERREGGRGRGRRFQQQQQQAAGSKQQGAV